MNEIIPTILVKTFKEVQERIKAVEDYVNWVQIDVMDGIFVYNETWPHSIVPGIATRGKKYIEEIEKLKNLKTKINIEVHLMVEKPEDEIDEWLKIAKRIIVHFESKITNRGIGIEELIAKCHKNKVEFGLALNPETHWAVATPFLKDLDLILLMSVQPGWGGQEMKAWVLEKAEALREKGYQGNIEIDGGVNDENIKKIAKSGVNLICAGTYIFRSKNIKKAIKNLKKLC
jgi:ribulose-phosphate 3-epimerase